MSVQQTSRYPHIVRAVFSRPWAIEPATLALILDILRFRVDGGRFSVEEIEERIAGANHGPRSHDTFAASRDKRRNGRSSDEAGPAIIPVYGAISQRQNLMAADSGGTSIEGLTRDFRDAMADPSVNGVVFEFDSPGGTIDGVDELATEIREARGGDKPIVAIANSMAASAAYWLAAQADETIVTPSGTVGSIGVFAAHEDLSVQAEAEGVKTTLISAGKYKTEGNPWEPLSDEARAHLQEMVDGHYNMMVSAIAKGRRTGVEQVRTGMGEGRVVLPKQALAAGMVDRIDTLDNTLARVARGAIGGRDAKRVSAQSGYRLAALDDYRTSNRPDDEGTDDPENDDELGTAPAAFTDRLTLVTAEAEALLVHARGRAGMRALKGRELSQSDRDGLRNVAASLAAIADGEASEPDEPESTDTTPEPPAMSAKQRVKLALAKAELHIS